MEAMCDCLKVEENTSKKSFKKGYYSSHKNLSTLMGS